VGILTIIVTAALLAGPQDVRFNTGKHLEGYEQVFVSEWYDLYLLDPFEDLDGKAVSRERLARLQSDWKAEKERVETLIREIRSDPRKLFRRHLDTIFRRDRFLQSATFNDRAGEGFLLLVQEPLDAGRVDVLFRPHLETLIRQFGKEYVEPLQLERNPRMPYLAILVLKSRGAYDDYARAKPGGHAMDWALAHYEPSQQISVTYEPGTARDAPSTIERKRRLAHEAIHALMHAHSASPDTPLSIWFNEGLAEYWSYSLGVARSGSLEFHTTPVDSLRSWFSLRSTGFGEILHPLEDLLSARNYGDAIQRARARCQKAGVAVPDEVSLTAFYVKACLVAAYLHDGAAPEIRAGFQAYIKDELQGHGGRESFQRRTGVTDLTALDQDFVKWADETAGICWGSPDPSVAESPAEAEAAPVPPPEPAPAGADELRGEVLLSARSGALQAAATRAAEIGFAAEDTELLHAMASFSEEVLGAAKKSGRNLVLEGSSKVIGKLIRFDEREIVLQPFRGEPQALPRSAFAPDAMLSVARKLNVHSPRAEAGLYLLMGLAPDEAANRTDLPEGEQRDAFAELAVRWTHLMKTADERNRLLTIVQAAKEPPSDLEPALEELRALLKSSGEESDSSRVARQAGTILLAEQFDRTGQIAHQFAAKPRVLKDGMLEFHYSFDSPEELTDFQSGAKLNEIANQLLPLTASQGGFRLSGQALSGTGDAELCHKVQFAAPLSMEYTVRYQVPPEGVQPRSLLAIVTGRGDEFAAAVDLNVLTCRKRNMRQNSIVEANPPLQITYGVDYKVKLEHGEQDLVLTVSDREIARQQIAGIPPGNLVFVHRGPETARIEDLTLRGKPDPDYMKRVRDEWVQAKLATWSAR